MSHRPSRRRRVLRASERLELVPVFEYRASLSAVFAFAHSILCHKCAFRRVLSATADGSAVYVNTVTSSQYDTVRCAERPALFGAVLTRDDDDDVIRRSFNRRVVCGV